MIAEIDALYQAFWKPGLTVVCIYHGVEHVLIGVALPDMILLKTLASGPEYTPLEKVTPDDPELVSVYTQLKADFANQQLA